MVRPGFMPVASAAALTVAATLSIAAEHTRSSPAVATGALPVHAAAQGPGEGGRAAKAAREAVTPAKGTSAVVPSLAVGSRALTGYEAEGPPGGR